jgi:hypothetical protein
VSELNKRIGQPSKSGMDGAINGGCACGAVRYALKSVPFDTGWCHCTICRGVSGAPAMVFTTVAAQDFLFTKGAEHVGSFASASFGRRQFCRQCGTPLTIEVSYQPETIDLAAATLDDPDLVRPGFHIFYASKIGWFETADDLPRHARFRPDTRGLEGTEPPA